jgi:hypothetical protein
LKYILIIREKKEAILTNCSSITALNASFSGDFLKFEFCQITLRFNIKNKILMGQWLSFVMGRTLSYEIHKVTLDDYEKVLSIRDAVDIHGGNDYIPNYFKTMMKSPENV